MFRIQFAAFVAQNVAPRTRSGKLNYLNYSCGNLNWCVMLKIEQLRQFDIAATGGSFKGAAAATFRSQAAVSIAIRELEKAIGAPLLEPERRGMFTPLARALLPMFQELLAVHDRVYSQSRQLAQGDHGSLLIAAPPFLTEKRLPELLPRFIARHPGFAFVRSRRAPAGYAAWSPRAWRRSASPAC